MLKITTLAMGLFVLIYNVLRRWLVSSLGFEQKPLEQRIDHSTQTLQELIHFEANKIVGESWESES